MAKVIYFDEGTSGSNGWLSNHSKHAFRCERDMHWPTVEHYFQAQKFFGDDGHMESIRISSTAKEAKRLGQSREHPLREGYENMKEELLLQGLRLKFAAHAALKRRLLATGDAYLAELSETDQYWGTDRALTGKNRLGHLLMQLRHELGGSKAPAKPSSAAGAASGAVSQPTVNTRAPRGASASLAVPWGPASVTKSFEAAVIVMPPKDMWDQIQAIRQKHDKAFVRWMPHVNLLFPFIAEDSFTPSLEEQCRVALGQLQPFEVELTSFGHFEHSKSNVVFCQPVTPTNPNALQEVHAALARIIPACSPQETGKPFTPHLTVGQFAKCDKRKREFAATWEPIRWRCEKVDIIRRSGSTPFEVQKSIYLGDCGGAADSDIHKEMEEALSSRLLLWIHKMQAQGQLPRTTERLANAIANMCFVSHKADADVLYRALLAEGYVSIDASGNAHVHSIALENYRSEYSTSGQAYRYSGMGSTAHLHGDEEAPSLPLPSRVELADMGKDRSVRWVQGLRSFSGNARSFMNQLKHVCTFKVLLPAPVVVEHLHERGLISLAEDDRSKIVSYNV